MPVPVNQGQRIASLLCTRGGWSMAPSESAEDSETPLHHYVHKT